MGKGDEYSSPILPELITGDKANVVMPRAQKDKVLHQARVLYMDVVFTFFLWVKPSE